MHIRRSVFFAFAAAIVFLITHGPATARPHAIGGSQTAAGEPVADQTQSARPEAAP